MSGVGTVLTSPETLSVTTTFPRPEPLLLRFIFDKNWVAPLGRPVRLFRVAHTPCDPRVDRVGSYHLDPEDGGAGGLWVENFVLLETGGGTSLVLVSRVEGSGTRRLVPPTGEFTFLVSEPQESRDPGSKWVGRVGVAVLSRRCRGSEPNAMVHPTCRGPQRNVGVSPTSPRGVSPLAGSSALPHLSVHSPPYSLVTHT